MYHISNLPQMPNIECNQHDFHIHLSPQWKELVTQSGFTSEDVHEFIVFRARSWLDSADYNQKFNPWHDDEALNNREAYLYNHHDIRVLWGKWGLEHISVPGSGCGLDIDANHRGMFPQWSNPVATQHRQFEAEILTPDHLH